MTTWNELRPQLTERRQQRLEEAARKRTEHLRLVIQDIHHPHNVSACMRSAEAFGVLNVDVVTMREKFNPSTVTKGSATWLRLTRFADVDTCAAHLKAAGYRLAAGFPDQDATPLDQIDISTPLAVVFANERDGADPGWLPHLDVRFTIPMVGLVESLNISVSCAITLYTLRQALHRQLGQRAYLSDAAVLTLLDEWAAKTG